MDPPRRELLLRHIVDALAADARVAAAWLTGSIGRGEDDAWSDLDLHVAIYDQHLTTKAMSSTTPYRGKADERRAPRGLRCRCERVE